MVIGIDKFTEFFRDFADSYIIIGGTACDIVTDEAGFEPRATDDIDMILIVEALTPEFVKRFLEFIKVAGYGSTQKDSDKRNCFRFTDRKDKSFPKQIELFSKVPDIIDIGDEVHITPIPVEEGLSSLSAILLNEEYYEFTIKHSTLKEGLHYANKEALICLKAFAYLSNLKRKEDGQPVRDRDIQKHKYDVFRMVFLTAPDAVFELPDSIKRDLKRFVDTIKDDLPTSEIFKVNKFGDQDMARLYEQLINNFILKNVIVITSEIESLLKKQKPKKVVLIKSPEIVYRTIHDIYFPFLNEVNFQFVEFNKLFKDNGWFYFEEPQPPKYKIPLMPVSKGYDGLLANFDYLSKKGEDSYHNFKASYWLMKYNDENDFDVEVAFKIFFYNDHYDIKIFIGRPYQSSVLSKDFIDMVSKITKTEATSESPFSIFAELSITDKKYDDTITADEIKSWVDQVNVHLLDVIKRKAENKDNEK